MTTPTPPTLEHLEGNAEELYARQRLLLHELKDRSLWFVRVRWWVPPAIWGGLILARLLGVGLPVVPVLAISVAILLYNYWFQRWHRRFVHEPALQSEDQLRRFTRYQMALDFLAIFIFVHYTGGTARSPFIFFFIFHVILASILLKHATAHAFAAAVALGVGLLAFAESFGWIPNAPVSYHGQVTLDLGDQGLPALFRWGFFAATVMISSYMTTGIMELVRRRIYRLAELSEAMITYNNRLKSLHTISQSIVSTRRLQAVLDLVCLELAKVLGIQGVSVKLLDEDGDTLRYVASHGLPSRFAPGKEVSVAHSAINRRIIEGESFATGHVTQDELFQLGEAFASAHVQSILFVPLRHNSHVIGILGAYCRDPERFRREDVDFLQLAAELVAIALENARAYEEIEQLGRQRQQFTLRVAHNLRAPLAAMVSMLGVLDGGLVGDLNAGQREYLQRVERRARSLNQFIDELLSLAEAQGLRRPAAPQPVDVAELTEKVARTFRDRAVEKSLAFSVETRSGLLPVRGDPGRLQNMIENLVSNAIKYTPPGGRVGIDLGPEDGGEVRLRVSDTGIGIPESAQPRLFTEFFRAENARATDSIGTGLGLVIVKEIVEQHHGRIAFESAEGRGTTFTVVLPTENVN